MYNIDEIDELRLASIVEKILAIEYISDGDLKRAINDIYGKRESIYMLTMAIAENLKSISKHDSKISLILGETSIKRIIEQRNFLGHGYDSLKPNITLHVIRKELPLIKDKIETHFCNAYKIGESDFLSQISSKNS